MSAILAARQWPGEIFPLEELTTLAGSPQRSRIISWLRERGIKHTVNLHGDPIVYRNALYDGSGKQDAAHRAETIDFDFSNLKNGTSRTPKERR